MRHPSADPIAPVRRRRFRRADDGNVAVLFALVLPLVIGSSGFGVETTYWYYKRLQLQAAADTAAHAGAMERQGGADEASVTTIASQAARENGYDPSAGTIAVHAPPTSGPSAGGNAVEVLLTFTAPRFFTALFAPEPVSMSSRAVATFEPASQACVLALDATAGRAAFFQGSSTLTLTGCSVMSNSAASDALETSGASTLTADCLIAVGGIESSNGGCRIENAPPAKDPYANVPNPAPPASCNGNNEFDPLKRFCNGLKLTGARTLDPGVYYVSGGDFEVGPGADIVGAGVTIYLANGAGVKLNNNHTINISAPTAGPYAGLLFYGARNSTGDVKFNGGANSFFTGAVYFPSRDLDWAGNHQGVNGCMHVIGNTVKWTGNSNISVDCSAAGMRPIPVGGIVKLTE